LHRRIDLPALAPGLTRQFIPFNQALLFALDKNSEQCEKRLRQQIAR
jgi:hypothetical protein